jgi:shikimate kinase
MSTDNSSEAEWSAKRSLVLVGMMGAGKSTVGRLLAARLGLPFVDVDQEIESATSCSIEEIFDRHGESTFRDIERQTIRRLLSRPAHVLATGGGAFMDFTTRNIIAKCAISLWLQANTNLLVTRSARSNHRPLLKGKDPRDVLENLQIDRNPVYATADIIIDNSGSLEDAINSAIAAIASYVTRSRLNTYCGIVSDT